MISTHFRDFWLMRAPIQSMVLLARSSSSSRHAFSISTRSEKRRANEGCGTVVRVVVLVFTGITKLQFGVLPLVEKEVTLG